MPASSSSWRRAHDLLLALGAAASLLGAGAIAASLGSAEQTVTLPLLQAVQPDAQPIAPVRVTPPGRPVHQRQAQRANQRVRSSRSVFPPGMIPGMLPPDPSRKGAESGTRESDPRRFLEDSARAAYRGRGAAD